MEIIVETAFVHPYLGSGETVSQWRFTMAEGFLAENKYLKLSKEDCDYHRTRIYIVQTPPAAELVEGGEKQQATGQNRHAG